MSFNFWRCICKGGCPSTVKCRSCRCSKGRSAVLRSHIGIQQDCSELGHAQSWKWTQRDAATGYIRLWSLSSLPSSPLCTVPVELSDNTALPVYNLSKDKLNGFSNAFAVTFSMIMLSMIRETCTWLKEMETCTWLKERETEYGWLCGWFKVACVESSVNIQFQQETAGVIKNYSVHHVRNVPVYLPVGKVKANQSNVSLKTLFSAWKLSVLLVEV